MDKHQAESRSTLAVVAAFIVSMEAAMLVIAGVTYAVYAWFSSGDGTGQLTLLATFAFILAGGVSAAAWGLWRGRRWARSIALTWQLLQAAVGVATMGDRPWVGGTLLAAALLVALAVMREVGMAADRKAPLG